MHKGNKMEKALIWICGNKGWVFSGIGVFLLDILIKVIHGKKQKKRKNNTIEMKNKGNNVTQIGIQNNYGLTGNGDGARENGK